MEPRPCCDGLSRWLAPALFKALGDPNRVGLLVRLAELGDERTVSQLAAGSPVDLSVVSRHLRTLREAGVVEARRAGKEVWYRVRYAALAETLRGLAAAVESCCPPTGGARGRRRRPAGKGAAR